MNDYRKHLEDCYYYLIAHRPDLKPKTLKETLVYARSLSMMYVEDNPKKGLYEYLDEKFQK